MPICTRRHAKIHHDGWIIGLGPHRELTLRLPDGTIRLPDGTIPNTRPPNHNTAA